MERQTTFQYPVRGALQLLDVSIRARCLDIGTASGGLNSPTPSPTTGPGYFQCRVSGVSRSLTDVDTRSSLGLSSATLVGGRGNIPRSTATFAYVYETRSLLAGQSRARRCHDDEPTAAPAATRRVRAGCHRWLRNASDWDGTGFHLANAVRGGAASCHHRPDRGARANRSAAGKPWVGRLKERHIPGASSRAHP